jgi:hypothetical protein
MKILHLTETTFNYSLKNPNSQLLDSVDCDFAHFEYHTSIGDLQIDQIIAIARHFDHVDVIVEGFNPSTSSYYEVVSLCKFLNDEFGPSQDIVNFVDDNNIYQRPDEPVLWVFGCSHSHGVGLLPDELRYGEIVSNELKLPLKLISKPGSSLNWSTRHIINADIRPHDIVIWQLTTPQRFSKLNGKHVDEIILSTSKDRHLIEVMTDEQIYFNHISLLNFGVRYLRLLNVKFVITAIVDNTGMFQYLTEYTKYPEYCYSSGIRIDLGTDQLHVGPLGHQLLAKRLINHIQCIYD